MFTNIQYFSPFFFKSDCVCIAIFTKRNRQLTKYSKWYTFILSIMAKFGWFRCRLLFHDGWVGRGVSSEIPIFGWIGIYAMYWSIFSIALYFCWHSYNYFCNHSYLNICTRMNHKRNYLYIISETKDFHIMINYSLVPLSLWGTSW